MLDDRSGPLAAKTILVVDDDPFVREAMVYLLEEEGFRVVQAGDGREAFERLTELAPSPSLIILDLKMPFMDGAEFLRLLRADTRHGSVPVLLVSGSDTTEVLPTADGLLHKPFDGDRLLEMIQKLVDRSERR